MADALSQMIQLWESKDWINSLGIVLMGHIYNPIKISTQKGFLGDM